MCKLLDQSLGCSPSRFHQITRHTKSVIIQFTSSPLYFSWHILQKENAFFLGMFTCKQPLLCFFRRQIRNTNTEMFTIYFPFLFGNVQSNHLYFGHGIFLLKGQCGTRDQYTGFHFFPPSCFILPFILPPNNKRLSQSLALPKFSRLKFQCVCGFFLVRLVD